MRVLSVFCGRIEATGRTTPAAPPVADRRRCRAQYLAVTDDKGGELIKQGVLATVAANIPGVSLALQLAGIAFGDNDERLGQEWNEVLWELLQDHKRQIDALESELRRQGKKLDDLDAVQKQKLTRDLVQALFETVGNAKRQALINLAAHQADPRVSAPARRFWWRTLVALDEEQVDVLAKLGIQPLTLNLNDKTAYWADIGAVWRYEGEHKSDAPPRVEWLQAHEVQSYAALLAAFAAAHPGLVAEDRSPERPQYVRYSLTDAGRELFKLIENIVVTTKGDIITTNDGTPITAG